MSKCDICGREFKTEAGMKIHKARHAESGEQAWREELAQLAAIVRQQAAQIETMKAEKSAPLTPEQEAERKKAMEQYGAAKQQEAVNAIKNAPKVPYTAGDKPISKALNGCSIYIPAGETAMIPVPFYELIMADNKLKMRAREMTARAMQVSNDRTRDETFNALNAVIKDVI